MNILHCYADDGVECEVLSAYGEVTRVGLNPTDNRWTDTLIASDVRDLTNLGQFDLGLFHPPCPKWANMTHIHGDREDHDDLIPFTRRFAPQHCDEWIIENVPKAPLNDPVRLNGGMFGLPLHYERAFETSYHVEQPPVYERLFSTGGPFEDHHDTGGWTRSVELWKSAKGYTGDHNAESLKREAVPRAYLNYLIRPLLD